MFEPTNLPQPPVTRPLACVPQPLTRAAVLGAGAWGTALAAALQRAGVATTLWARRADRAHHLNTTHRTDVLPGVALPSGLRATHHLATAIEAAQVVLFAVPASATRELACQVAGLLAPGTLVLSASKGFEPESGAFMTEVLDDTLGHPIFTGVLSGPSFALGVAQGDPTLLTLAMAALDPGHPKRRLVQRQADALARALALAHLRVESTPDVIGAQVGGALKNQIAIACGMATALELGENARAGILSRGLDDMRRLTLALGGRAETLLGSCGVGDLFLTAASPQSRNTRLGMRLAGGATGIACEQDELAEGAFSARTVARLEDRLGIRLDLAAAVRDVLDGVRTPADALAGLLEPRTHALPRPRPATPPAPPPDLPALLRPFDRTRKARPAQAHSGESSHV